MSWMDSWSRPSANSKVPAPLYLATDHAPYCHTCGRAMTSKKSAKTTKNEIKYCSDRCRGRKPGPADRKIEQTITGLLNGEEDSGLETTAAHARRVKGDQRNIVTCAEIEEIIFGSRFDPEKVYGRRKNRKSRAIGKPGDEWKSIDMVSDQDTDGDQDLSQDEKTTSKAHVNGVLVRLPQDQSDVNFSVGGERGKAEKIEESAEDLEKRKEGDRKAEEREMIRRAARRVIVFGVEVPKRVDEGKHGKSKARQKKGIEDEEEESQTEIRKAEALMQGTVVEPSFAKGNWSIRWRE